MFHYRYKLFIFLALATILPKYSLAVDRHAWEFSTEQDLMGWQGQGARFTFIKREGIVHIEAGADPIFISPPEINLSIDKTYFLKIKLKSFGGINPKGFLFFKPKSSSISFFRPFPSFDIKSDGRFHDYKISFNEEIILGQFAIAFRGMDVIEVDSIEVYKASFVEIWLARLKKGFSSEEVIGGWTINSVMTPKVGEMSFLTFLYIVAAILSIGLVIFKIIFKRRFIADDIKRAVIISLVLSGLIFALRMDYNWLRIMRRNIDIFSGTDVAQRINIINGHDLYSFITIAKKHIPQDKFTLKISEQSDDYFAIKGKYYLMPIKTSKEGEYVLVYMDKTVVFDPVTKTLTKDGKTIASNVEMVYNHNNYGFIYRIIKDNKDG